jgi:hypothetical protein
MRKKKTVDCGLVPDRSDPLSDLPRLLLARDSRKLSMRNMEIRQRETNQ